MPSDPSIHRPPLTQRSCSSRAGYSLLEVVVAITLVSTTLVPSLQLMRDGIDLSAETDRRQLLASYACSELEKRMALTASVWATGSYSGDYASDGFPNLRYETVCSDEVSSGGSVDLLMDLRVTTYDDQNGNDSFDPDEMSCSFRTKIGKFATYQALTP